MGFFSGIFGGKNDTLNTNIPALQGVGATATSTGSADVTTGSDFFRGLLDGKATSVLAPQIRAQQNQGANKLQTLFQFGNRSGGTNAQAATTADSTRANINDMIAKLKGQAAGSLSTLGSSLLNTGIGAYNASSDTSQMRMNNWKDSIAGNAITSPFSFLESFGLRKPTGS